LQHIHYVKTIDRTLQDFVLPDNVTHKLKIGFILHEQHLNKPDIFLKHPVLSLKYVNIELKPIEISESLCFNSTQTQLIAWEDCSTFKASYSTLHSSSTGAEHFNFTLMPYDNFNSENYTQQSPAQKPYCGAHICFSVSLGNTKHDNWTGRHLLTFNINIFKGYPASVILSLG
jgi:hypothetical protein